MGEKYHFIITEEDLQKYKRLDQYLVDKLDDHSRSFIKKLFEQGAIYASAPVTLELKKMPAAQTNIFIKKNEPESTDLKAEHIPLDVLYEDSHLIVINKSAGMVTHPAPGNYQGTLVNALLAHCRDLQGVGNQLRPGIVHRLDKGTSGVMVAAKNQKTHEKLVDLFSKHNIERKYQAIIMGNKMNDSGIIQTQIARSPYNRLKMTSKTTKGKEAITQYKICQRFKFCSHAEFKLETGRTHQIRVHCSEVLNAAILGDPLYANVKEQLKNQNSSVKKIMSQCDHQLLHAKILGFIHPITKKELYFEQTPPQIFQNCLSALEED